MANRLPELDQSRLPHNDPRGRSTFSHYMDETIYNAAGLISNMFRNHLWNQHTRQADLTFVNQIRTHLTALESALYNSRVDYMNTASEYRSLTPEEVEYLKGLLAYPSASGDGDENKMRESVLSKL